MVAYQQDGGNTGARKADHPPPPLALESRLRVSIFVGVAGKQHQVNLLGDGPLHYLVQCIEEIDDSHGQPRFRVVAPVVGNIDVGVGEM